jgi:hypothetical protein
MSFAPGTTVRCTITAAPVSEGDQKTIARLMRRDPANRRALARAQHLRRQRMNVYNRGNRDWVSREKPAQVVVVRPGCAWSMTYTLDIAPELAKVGRYVKIEKA